MKRISTLILCIFIITMMSACGSRGASSTSGTSTSKTTEQSTKLSDTDTDTAATTSEKPTTPISSMNVVEEQTPQQETTLAPEVIFSAADANDLTLTAQSLIGIPFAEGGSDPENGFDNSGFIYYVLTQNGFVNTPRLVGDQAAMGDEISSLSDLLPGDLVFFSTSGARAEFGGIYIGDGNMVYSGQPGEMVKEQNLDSDYWKRNFFVGVRVL